MNDQIPTLAVPCAPFGAAAVLVLVPMGEPEDDALLAAFWYWPDGSERLAAIGEA